MKERINKIIEAYTEKKNFFYGAADQTEKAIETCKAARKAERDKYKTLTEVKKAGGYSEEYHKLGEKIDELRKELEIYRLSEKVADENGLEAVANAVLEEMQKDPEKWTKIPTHYKRFKNMVSDVFADRVRIYTGGYNNNRVCVVCNNYFSYDGTLKQYGFSGEVVLTYDGFNAEAIRKATPRQPYKPEEIEEVTRAAVEAKNAYTAKYEATRAELSSMNVYRGVLSDIFPYIPYLKNS